MADAAVPRASPGATPRAGADCCLCPDLKLGDACVYGAQVLQGEAG